MKDAYACDPRDENNDPVEFNCIVCEDDPGDANNNCESAASAVSLSYDYLALPQISTCDHLTASSCAGWDPDGAVTPVTSTQFTVDEDFFAGVVSDPSQLTDCDGARVQQTPSGYYKVVNASAGDFLYEIGLRNDHVVQSINGYSITGPFSAMIAFFNLWPGTTTFSLTVDDGGTTPIIIVVSLV